MDISTLDVLRPAFQAVVLIAIVTALAVRYAQCGREQDSMGGGQAAEEQASRSADSQENRGTRDMARISLSLERARSYSARELGLLKPAGVARRPAGPRLL
jgi:hypothetical protein